MTHITQRDRATDEQSSEVRDVWLPEISSSHIRNAAFTLAASKQGAARKQRNGNVRRARRAMNSAATTKCEAAETADYTDRR